MTDVYLPLRDQVTAPITVNGKDVGYFKSLNFTIDNSPFDIPETGTRVIQKSAGGLAASGRFDRYHTAVLDPKLLEIALGKTDFKYDESVPPEVDGDIRVTRPEDMLSSYWTIEQIGHDLFKNFAVQKLYAQSFVSRADMITGQNLEVYLFLGKTEAVPDNLGGSLNIHIYSDNTDEPSDKLWSGNILASDISDTAIWKKIILTRDVGVDKDLAAGTKYWIVTDPIDLTGQTPTDYVSMYYNSLNDAFVEGSAKSKDGVGAWTVFNYDLGFLTIFPLKTHLEFKARSSDGVNKETVTFSKLTLSNVEFTVEPNAIMIETGSWSAEDETAENEKIV